MSIYNNMPEPEEFGPNAIKIGDMIFPARDITRRSGTNRYGPWEAVEWWTPVESHPEYKIAHFDWTREIDYDGFTEISYVVIQFFGDEEDDDLGMNTTSVFDSQKYWHLWAEYYSTEDKLKQRWDHIIRPREF